MQNAFYWKAYGESAFNKLTEMMGSYYTNLTYNQKVALKGVLFSIMEARYRKKNVQGKSNLQIKAAEGELCPFLVNLKNLDKIVRSGSSGDYTYIDSIKQCTYYEFPPFDELIDGVYHYIIYYDKETLNSTTYSTLTSKMASNAEEEEVNADFESEYYSLTGLPLTALSGDKLEKFYSNCYFVRYINSQGVMVNQYRCLTIKSQVFQNIVNLLLKYLHI